MRRTVITIVSVLLAVVGWWGLWELTGKVTPDRPGALSLFYALLFLAVTTTLAPAAAYLNLRFAPAASKRDPWRFVRHSAWAGLCAVIGAWLQVNRALNLGLVVIVILIFVALEVMIDRLRGRA
jgi:hypothetical protein